MSYTRAYIIEHLNYNGVKCKATIFDAYSQVPGLVLYQPKKIDGGGNPIVISSIDTDENKFSPIRAKKCTLSFLSSPSYNLSLFAEGEDNRWYVRVNADGGNGNWNIFSGFLVLDDCREPYQPHPNLVTLTATDNLGLLKETPLTDFEGNNPKGKFPIIQYIAWALAKTNNRLNIRVYNNLVEESGPLNVPFYNEVYLDAKTFEGAEIGTSISCYEVLKRIFAFDSFLQQRNDEYWIMRVDEMEAGAPVYGHLFDNQGAFIESLPATFIDYEIGSLRDSFLINADQEITLIRKHKFDKLTYKYDYPKELLDNQDFSRGALVTPDFVPPKSVTIGEGVVQEWTGSAFSIDDWALYEFVLNTNSEITPGYPPARVVRYFFEGYERERFVRMQAPTAGNILMLRSNRIPMDAKDRFSFSVDWRTTTNRTGNPGYPQGLRLGEIRLYGNDGTFWKLGNDYGRTTKGKWMQSMDGSFKDITENNEFGFHWDVTDLDETDWMTATVNANALPVSGEIEVNLNMATEMNFTERHYTNMKFDYEPYINGGYRKFEGHYNKVEEDGNYKANTDDEIHISDSPKKLFKGAMFIKDENGKFKLAGRFYNAAVFRERPAEEYFNTYGKTQVYALHNQYNRTFRIITGSVQNANAANGNEMPDSMRIYKIAEEGSHAEGRRFMLPNFTIGLRTEEWQATLIEVHGPEGKDYNAKHEFKYIG